MSRTLRQIFACLAVTLVVALQGYGVASAQHQVAHTVEFPGVSFEASSYDGHDHDHDQAVEDHDAGPSVDAATPDDGDKPVGHHHHSTGDLHIALNTASHPSDDRNTLSSRLPLGRDQLPPGADREAPSDPPKARA
ncbi:hypothetical protein [Brevundimonas aurantiaca]|uniref:hypothetical protein n=1 Tax=Brevundimonas aurantiaca TaxID=74316 RepID=UPI00191A37F0|nr:hypothetical protein [Brevundimonas aurantiaca]